MKPGARNPNMMKKNLGPGTPRVGTGKFQYCNKSIDTSLKTKTEKHEKQLKTRKTLSFQLFVL